MGNFISTSQSTDKTVEKDPMDEYGKLHEVLDSDIARFAEYAATPDTSPDLWDVAGTDAKRKYYHWYSEALKMGRHAVR